MLYISNTTKQNFWFHWSLPGGPEGKWRLQSPLAIPSGQQRPIPIDLSPAEKQSVIVQLERFGARDAAESYGKMPNFSGILYRDEGVISEQEIVSGHDEVVKAQEERTVAAAVNTVKAVDFKLRHPKTRQDPPAPRTTAMELKQDIAPNARPTGDEAVMSVEISAAR